MAAETKRSIPVWLLAGLIAIALLVVGCFVWSEFTHGSVAGIPDRKVKPNMYDFRKEAQNGNLGRRPD